MYLFFRIILSEGRDLLTYMDDGTLIAQSKTLEENLLKLQGMYDTIVDITTRLGLKLEHDKNELFHFTRSPRDGNLLLDLGSPPLQGYAPSTKEILEISRYFL